MSEAPATPPKLQDIPLADMETDQLETGATISSKSKPQAISKVVIDDEHPFSIEPQATRFKSRTGIVRLLHIADSCPQLAPPALEAALNFIKQYTLDHELYHAVVVRTELVPDEEWMEQTARDAQEQQVKLEVELRGYQSNLIKESIRLTQMALGHHAVRTGSVSAAIKHFASSREYSSTPQHQIDISLAIIEAALSFKHSISLEPHIAKLEASIDRLPAPANAGGKSTAADMSLSAAEVRARSQTDRQNAKHRENLMGKVRVVKALIALGGGDLERAARGFAGVIENGGLGDWDGKIIDKADLALFASLTALATLPRSAIKSLLTDNASFRALADDADRFVTDMLEAFITAQFKTVIDLLERNQPTIKLNPHLAPYATKICSAIRTRACIQYFAPFKAVQISQMAKAFGTEPDAMLAEVVSLVQDGRLNARVDLIDRVLERKTPDARGDVFEKAVQVGHDANVATARAYLRMLLVENKIAVERPISSQPEGQDEMMEDVVETEATAGAEPSQPVEPIAAESA